MRYLSLRMKIMICCVGLVALLDLMVVLYVRSKLSGTLRTASLAKGCNMALNLAECAEHLVLTENIIHLLEHVTELKENDEDIVYAYTVDRRGRVLAHTFAGGFPQDLKGVNVPNSGDSLNIMLLDTEEAGLIHDIAVPILDGKVGVVHVGISEQRIQHTISEFTFVIVGIAGFVLLVAVGLAAVVSWVVTRPVHSLIKAAQKIRDGNLGQQVVATSHDEIGELVDSFNQMSEELLKQHKVLDDRNRRIVIAREQAAGERNKLRAIIDSMVEGVIFVDAQGTISLCNESAERIWGTKAEELLGKSLLQCHPPKMRPQVERILTQAEQKPGFALTREMRSAKGYCRLSNYSSVHDEDGRYLGLVLLSQDISERTKLEQEHRHLRDQLFQQEKMVLIGQIAASVAHELNTPLGTILLRTQLLHNEMNGDHDLSDLNVVESEAKRCRNIIDSLLGFSRRSEGTMSQTDVNSLTRQSLSLVKNDLTLKGITLEIHCASNEAMVWADSNQIQQVLLNLVTNATDAMPDGGRLQITTRFLSDQDVVEIQVSDNGCGMEQEVLDRALEAFFTTKERGKGTGLGLPVCQRIIEEHKGQIEIHSRPGKGTTVFIRLPRAYPEVSAGE